MSIEIGQAAPDIELKDQNKNPWKLSDHRGEKVALVFFPFAFSGVCSDEFCTIRDEQDQFKNEGALAVGISCDTTHANRGWSVVNGFEFPILADRWPLGDVAKAYGCFNEDLGVANRLTVIVDADGNVVETFATGALTEARDSADYHTTLSALV